MPLASLSLDAVLQWQFTRSNTGFGNTTEGIDSLDFNTASLLAAYNQASVQQLSLAAALPAPSSFAAVLASGGSLTVSTTYYYVITATNANGETTRSSEVSVTPTSGNQTADLTWSADAGATGYKIYRSTTSGSYGASSLLTTIGSGATVSYNDTGGALSAGSPPSVNTTGAITTIDLTSLTNLVYESFSLAHVLLLMLVPTGSDVHMTPGASNPLQWFFDGSSQGLTVHKNGVFLYCEDPGNTGVAVTGTAKTLAFQNAGSAGAATLNLVVAGSTT